MEFKHERWYTICNEHKKKVDVDGHWTPGGEAETCDYVVKGNKRCRKDAPWEFYPGLEWD